MATKAAVKRSTSGTYSTAPTPVEATSGHQRWSLSRFIEQSCNPIHNSHDPGSKKKKKTKTRSLKIRSFIIALDAVPPKTPALPLDAGEAPGLPRIPVPAVLAPPAPPRAAAALLTGVVCSHPWRHLVHTEQLQLSSPALPAPPQASLGSVKLMASPGATCYSPCPAYTPVKPLASPRIPVLAAPAQPSPVPPAPPTASPSATSSSPPETPTLPLDAGEAPGLPWIPVPAALVPPAPSTASHLLLPTPPQLSSPGPATPSHAAATLLTGAACSPTRGGLTHTALQQLSSPALPAPPSASLCAAKLLASPGAACSSPRHAYMPAKLLASPGSRCRPRRRRLLCRQPSPAPHAPPHAAAALLTRTACSPPWRCLLRRSSPPWCRLLRRVPPSASPAPPQLSFGLS
ncbi:hypothetical protein E2562_009193 [Oryza meyeriana var. granulata]|uniref:Uncharacterized protein n=1 Tax=Oryza meyeriana var. granulata TaxID=110450 RepID=A0A6G1D1B2_9ORYZ|nr:hypothetical protein E2562_009193 [Oryza meyeriana var. granulata]